MTPPMLTRAALSADAKTRKQIAGDIIIATINRDEGDTGVHAHTRSLLAGLDAAEQPSRIVSSFSGSRIWMGVFGVRRLFLDAINKTWSTRWHRYWHRVALQQNLVSECATAAPGAVIAQCPLSAQAALAARAQLKQHYPIVAVCHFNYSEATEYRDKGELGDERSFQRILNLEQAVLQQVDAVIYVSAFARDVVEQQRSIRPRRSEVIWNGIAEASPAAADRKSIDVAEDDVLLINVGSLEGRKNQLGLLDLFAIVAARSQRAKLILVGEGADREAITAKVQKLGLTGRVRMLGFRRDVAALLAASDVYVHFARLENCPVVLLEAARAGLSIATLPAGGAAEVLDALGAGVLLNAENLQRSASDMMPLIERASLRRELGARTREGFDSHFTVEAMVERYLDVMVRCK